jgi:hypothetical protein
MMMNYYEVFKQRLSADGTSYKEQIEKIAQRNFDRYLSETPTAIDILYEGDKYKVAIVENKQDEFRLSKQMLTSLNESFPIGSLIYWEYFKPLDCPENFWIVWKQQQNSIQDHNVYYISRCNHKLKWIDGDGVRHEQYVYEFSSKENMIRATFKSRVQEIIASEPNKFMEIIMPFTTNIKREQRFIVDGEAWYVIEFDSSSVEGITYITLGEDKKDLQQDLLIAQGDEEDLANYGNENKHYILVMNNNPIVEENTSYIIKPYYYEEGNLIENSIFNFYINDELIGNGKFLEQIYSEDCDIEIRLANNENIKNIVNLQVSAESQTAKTYSIIGDSSIKWGKTAIYSVDLQQNGIIISPENISYSINNEILASLEQEDNIAYITANNKRKIGKIILVASGNDFSIEKEISITSLW